jgi:hypothetical protein
MFTHHISIAFNHDRVLKPLPGTARAKQRAEDAAGDEFAPPGASA